MPFPCCDEDVSREWEMGRKGLKYHRVTGDQKGESGVAANGAEFSTPAASALGPRSTAGVSSVVMVN